MTFEPTLVRLLSNVPFFNDYKHTRSFNDSTEQRLYFEDLITHSYTDFTYQRQEQSIKVPGLYDQLYNCNYVMFHNPDNIYKKWFYGFITRKEYVNPHTTRIYFEIDVYQTWMWEMKWNPSFIAREHRLRFNADGTPVVNTVDEGLDYGTDYDIVAVEHFVPADDVYYLVIGCKQSLHIKNTADQYIINANVNGITQPLSFYILPMRKSGDAVPTYVGGASVPLDRAQYTLQKLYEAGTAADNIVSLCITQHLGVNVSYDGSCHFDTPAFMDASIEVTDASPIHLIALLGLTSYEANSKTFSDKYSDYNNVTEGKLLMYPYTVLSMTDYKGNHVTLRNEYINQNDLEVMVRGSIGTSNKVAYYVNSYNQGNTGQPAWLENVLIDDNPNDVPIIHDLLSAYLQGNRNSLALQKAQINYNQNMDLVMGGIGAARGAIQGGAVGLVTGGPIGAAAGALTGAAPAIASTAQGYVNHQFELGAMMAKQRDISAQPPALSKMGSNSYWDFGNDINGVYLVKKQIKAEYRKKLTDYFKLYGYQVNELKLPNLKTRESFNYVQTVGANIYGNIPNEELFRLKTIFDTGITIWHGDFVGDYDRSNDEL